jgi:hypothetical protein
LHTIARTHDGLRANTVLPTKRRRQRRSTETCKPKKAPRKPPPRPAGEPVRRTARSAGSSDSQQLPREQAGSDGGEL